MTNQRQGGAAGLEALREHKPETRPNGLRALTAPPLPRGSPAPPHPTRIEVTPEGILVESTHPVLLWAGAFAIALAGLVWAHKIGNS